MPDTTEHPRSVSLTLPPAEHWTLHHVLLDRVERESTATDPTGVDPPPVEAFRAFETLDAGGTRFTVGELEAMRAILAEYHHSTTWWAVERRRIERLLHRTTERIEAHRAALPAH